MKPTEEELRGYYSVGRAFDTLVCELAVLSQIDQGRPHAVSVNKQLRIVADCAQQLVNAINKRLQSQHPDDTATADGKPTETPPPRD